MLQEVLCRANTVGIVEGQVQIFLVLQRTYMLTGHRCAHCHALVYTLGRIEQEPVGLAVALQPHKVSAANEIPAEVAFPIHCLGKGEGQFLPAADLCGEVEIKCLSLGLQFRVVLLAQLYTIHVVNGYPP